MGKNRNGKKKKMGKKIFQMTGKHKNTFNKRSCGKILAMSTLFQ